mmetsp:Transcript_45643/g.146959  ORF Transcript_45643/g.146959 Transcript_45643/m.146959 type:complete len:291 (-) Transcript_45643:296-1168(-)
MLERLDDEVAVRLVVRVGLALPRLVACADEAALGALRLARHGEVRLRFFEVLPLLRDCVVSVVREGLLDLPVADRGAKRVGLEERVERREVGRVLPVDLPLLVAELRPVGLLCRVVAEPERRRVTRWAALHGQAHLDDQPGEVGAEPVARAAVLLLLALLVLLRLVGHQEEDPWGAQVLVPVLLAHRPRLVAKDGEPREQHLLHRGEHLEAPRRRQPVRVNRAAAVVDEANRAARLAEDVAALLLNRAALLGVGSKRQRVGDADLLEREARHALAPEAGPRLRVDRVRPL